MPKLIIIPGAGSSDLNWLDQLVYFEKQNFKSHFLEYKADLHENMSDCAYHLAEELSTLTESSRSLIIAHSMGAMLLLKALSETKVSEKLKISLSNSEVFLVQCPPNANPKLLKSLKSFRGLLSTGMHLHQPLKKIVRENLEKYKLKFLEKKELSKNAGNELIEWSLQEHIKDLAWILSAMHISAWGTQPSIFKNLINYYEEWHYEKITEKDLSHLHDLNIHLTVSNSDIFCSKSDSLKLAEKLNANIKHFDWTFHNPMHFPWSKNDFNQWILKHQ